MLGSSHIRSWAFALYYDVSRYTILLANTCGPCVPVPCSLHVFAEEGRNKAVCYLGPLVDVVGVLVGLSEGKIFLEEFRALGVGCALLASSPRANTIRLWGPVWTLGALRIASEILMTELMHKAIGSIVGVPLIPVLGSARSHGGIGGGVALSVRVLGEVVHLSVASWARRLLGSPCLTLAVGIVEHGLGKGGGSGGVSSSGLSSVGVIVHESQIEIESIRWLGLPLLPILAAIHLPVRRAMRGSW